MNGPPTLGRPVRPAKLDPWRDPNSGSSLGPLRPSHVPPLDDFLPLFNSFEPRKRVSVSGEQRLNVYGRPLDPCAKDEGDHAGEWVEPGQRCVDDSEKRRQICVADLPSDFSALTSDGRWSQERFEGRGSSRQNDPPTQNDDLPPQ